MIRYLGNEPSLGRHEHGFLEYWDGKRRPPFTFETLVTELDALMHTDECKTDLTHENSVLLRFLEWVEVPPEWVHLRRVICAYRLAVRRWVRRAERVRGTTLFPPPDPPTDLYVEFERLLCGEQPQPTIPAYLLAHLLATVPPPGSAGRVVLKGKGQPVVVCSVPKPSLPDGRYRLIKALVSAGDLGLSKAEIEHSGEDARRYLRGLKESDPHWRLVIRFPGRRGGRYRIT